ncbi:MAG: anti-sigma factor family protein, partial [Saprospiraceae bacterium]
MDKQWMQQRLMDYLYDELDAAEKQEVEQWLAENPEAQEELAALQQTRGFLAQLPSVKPVKPAPLTSSSLRISRRWLPA